MSRILQILSILILCFICSTSSLKLQGQRLLSNKNVSQKPNSSVSANPKFINQKGPGTTEAQMSQFRSLVHSSSFYYPEDSDDRLNYISTKMQERFQHMYSVFMLKNPSNWDISLMDITVNWGSLGKGSDSMFPNNSYMFVKDDYDFISRKIFNHNLKTGRDIDQQFEQVISNIIWAVQRFQENCNCYRAATSIRQYIERFQGYYDWNVFCSSEPNFNTAIWVFYEYYMVTKQKCYYVIYED